MNEIFSWLSTQPKWLQIASRSLVDHDNITEESIGQFAEKCIQEVSNKLDGINIEDIAVQTVSSFSNNLRIKSISDLIGINALSADARLDFDKGNISVIFGKNGSGKSSYIRLIKKICDAPNKETLHPHVFNAARTKDDQAATIEYEFNGKNKTFKWQNNGYCDELTMIDIFDESSSRFFLVDHKEVCYEPPNLAFLSLLVSLCEQVASYIDREIEKLPQILNMPNHYIGTPQYGWYSSISRETSETEVDAYCEIKNHEIDDYKLQQKILSDGSPSDQLKSIKSKKNYLERIIQQITDIADHLSTDNVEKIIELRQNLNLKKEAAETAANVFSQASSLEGIGSEIWMELWAAAKKYSTEIVYKGAEFPYIDDEACCVLCHQPLSTDAQNRLLSFEKYIKNETQIEVDKLTKSYDNFLQKLKINEDELIIYLDAAGVDIIEVRSALLKLPLLSISIIQAYDQNNNESIKHAAVFTESAKTAIAQLSIIVDKYDKQILNLDDASKNGSEDNAKKRIKEFEAKKWLIEQKQAIKEEIKRLKHISILNEAKRRTNTRSLSMKKGEIAEQQITAAFIERFNKELDNLGAKHIKARLVKSGTSKGKVLHCIKLAETNVEAPIINILSEGERKLISLAAFLADVTGKRYTVPLIFDDPISSLDQENEEAVIQRLADLSSEKQIVIFTHRLSLLAILRDYAKTKKYDLKLISIRSDREKSGLSAILPLSQKEVKTQLEILLNQRCLALKKAESENDHYIVEDLKKSICSHFRIAIEHSIENILLCDIIQRFRRSIQTLRIKDLAKITLFDCEQIDDLMTTYSKYEHAAPTEAPVELPSYEVLIADITRLKNWCETYSKREIPTS